MKKMTVLDLCLCAMMIALHIVLELFATVRIGNSLKITFATLPFIVIGMLAGSLEGLVSGLLGTFLSQLLTFGITITTLFWILPGAMCGWAAGLIYKAFGRKNVWWKVVLTVALSNLVLVIFNLIASYFDGVVVYKYLIMETLYALIPMRMLVWAGLCIVYSLVMIPLCRTLQKRMPGDVRMNLHQS